MEFNPNKMVFLNEFGKNRGVLMFRSVKSKNQFLKEWNQVVSRAVSTQGRLLDMADKYEEANLRYAEQLRKEADEYIGLSKALALATPLNGWYISPDEYDSVLVSDIQIFG